MIEFGGELLEEESVGKQSRDLKAIGASGPIVFRLGRTGSGVHDIRGRECAHEERYAGGTGWRIYRCTAMLEVVRPPEPENNRE